MILATHAVIAAAAAKPLIGINPGLGFLAAAATHYLADAIPHWDYGADALGVPETSAEKRLSRNPAVLRKFIIRAALDAAAGAGLLWLFLAPGSYAEMLYALAVFGGAILPDFLQGIHILNPKRTPFLAPHQRFHDWMHTKIRLGPYPLIGVPFQAAIALIAIYFLI